MKLDLALMGIYTSPDSTEEQKDQAAQALARRPQNQPDSPLITISASA